MNIIATKIINDIRYLMGSSVTAPNMYRQIKAAFPQSDVYKIFAEPIILEDGIKIAWASPYEGSAVNYQHLSDEDKSLAQDILSQEIGKLITEIKKFDNNEVIDFIYKCIEIPDLNDIYIVNSAQGKHCVITQWGFVNDTPGAEKGILNKFINIKKIPMKFQVVYSDDLTPAPFEDIIFEVDKKLQSAKSDSEGVIILEKIKENAFVKAFEASDKEKTSPQTYTCYENGNYTIKVTPKGDMNILVTDQNSVPQPGVEFTFEFDGRTEKATSDSGGRIILKRLKNSEAVSAYQMSETGGKNNLNNFIYNRSIPEYKIVIQVETLKVEEPEAEVPKTHNMRFKVIDEKNNVIKNAEVIVKYNNVTKTLRTDAEGYAELTDVPVGAVVEAKAKK